MARTNSAVAKPLVSRGYGKIVFFTLMAMLLGCGLMGYEIFVEYGADSIQAVRKQPTKVPSTLPPAEKGPAARPTGPVVPPNPNP